MRDPILRVAGISFTGLVFWTQMVSPGQQATPADWERAKKLPPPTPESIWADDADEWVIEPFLGNNSAANMYIQGAANEAGIGEVHFSPSLVWGDNGDYYMTGEGYVAHVDTNGTFRYLAGIPTVYGFRDGPAERALFSGIRAMVRGPKGQLYILDRGNFCIRELSVLNGRWVVKTIAGTPGKPSGRDGHKDGPALEATFGDPCNMAINSKGELFLFDRDQIRKVADGMVTTVPTCQTRFKKFNLIMGAYSCFDDKDVLYVADRWNHAVQKVNLETGEVVPVIGPGKGGGSKDGPALDAGFHDSPGFIIYEPVRQCFYTCGVDEPFIRRYKDGEIKTLAGGCGGNWMFGPAKGAAMSSGMTIVATDKAGDLYLSSGVFWGFRKIRYIGTKRLVPKNREVHDEHDSGKKSDLDTKPR